MQKKEWYKTWFDTIYYHILYKNRNDKEAHFFMDNLVESLNVKPNSKILDLACGKGRHSIYLNDKSLNVTGVDLSKQSILHAKQFENKTLSFDVHDMREVYNKKFNFVFNLFTSFGYFEDDNDNQKVVDSMSKMIEKDGVIVIDFLNAVKTMNQLVLSEVKEIDDITFNISRKVINNFIVKTIQFNDKGIDYSFEERVNALVLADFEKYFTKAKLQLIHTFGNFKLDEFEKNSSDRLIMVLKKL